MREALSRRRRAGHHDLPRSELAGRRTTELYRGANCVIDFLPKVKIEAAIADDMAERAIEGH